MDRKHGRIPVVACAVALLFGAVAGTMTADSGAGRVASAGVGVSAHVSADSGKGGPVGCCAEGAPVVLPIEQVAEQVVPPGSNVELARYYDWQQPIFSGYNVYKMQAQVEGDGTVCLQTVPGDTQCEVAQPGVWTNVTVQLERTYGPDPIGVVISGQATPGGSALRVRALQVHVLP